MGTASASTYQGGGCKVVLAVGCILGEVEIPLHIRVELERNVGASGRGEVGAGEGGGDDCGVDGVRVEAAGGRVGGVGLGDAEALGGARQRAAGQGAPGERDADGDACGEGVGPLPHGGEEGGEGGAGNRGGARDVEGGGGAGDRQGAAGEAGGEVRDAHARAWCWCTVEGYSLYVVGAVVCVHEGCSGMRD